MRKQLYRRPRQGEGTAGWTLQCPRWERQAGGAGQREGAPRERRFQGHRAGRHWDGGQHRTGVRVRAPEGARRSVRATGQDAATPPTQHRRYAPAHACAGLRCAYVCGGAAAGCRCECVLAHAGGSSQGERNGTPGIVPGPQTPASRAPPPAGFSPSCGRGLGPSATSASRLSPSRRTLRGNYFLETLSRFLKGWSGLQQPSFVGGSRPGSRRRQAVLRRPAARGRPGPALRPGAAQDARSEPKAICPSLGRTFYSTKAHEGLGSEGWQPRGPGVPQPLLCLTDRQEPRS